MLNVSLKFTVSQHMVAGWTTGGYVRTLKGVVSWIHTVSSWTTLEAAEDRVVGQLQASDLCLLC